MKNKVIIAIIFLFAFALTGGIIMAINLQNSYKTITWDLSDKVLDVNDFGKEGENGKGFKIQLLQGTAAVTPTTETLRMYFYKPDGNSVYIDGEISGGLFIVKCTNEVYSAPGTVKAELHLNVNGEWRISDTFEFKAYPNLVDGSVESSTELTALQNALAKVDNFDSKKADKEYVDSLISNIGNASPKGVYATKAALDVAFPTGTSGIYVVSEDGKWYFWDGTDWTPGGQYQSTGIADGSITPEKTNSEIPNTRSTYNLFEKSEAVVGKYINSTTGVETANASFGYITIAVVPGEYLFLSGDFSSVSNRGAGFDAEGNYVSSLAQTGYYRVKADGSKLCFMIPSGVYIAKINFAVSSIDNILIYQNALMLHNDSTIEDRWISDNVVKKDAVPFISNIIDSINDIANQDYCYFRADGTIAQSSAFWSYAPIPVTESEIYLVESYLQESTTPTAFTSRGVFLDENFAFLNALPVVNSYSPEYTVPAGASYMIINYDATLADIFSVKRIYTPSQSIQIRKDSIYPPISDSVTNVLKDKVWVSFGDSITANNNWQPYVASYYGLEHINCGVNSSPLAGDNANAFWQSARINAVKDANPDVITILGGANDLVYDVPIGDVAQLDMPLENKDTGNFIGAYSYIIETLLTWKPTLKIILLTPTYAHNDGNDVTHNSGLIYTDYAEATKKVAAYYGLPCADLHGEAGINKITQAAYTNDGIHLNEVGAKRVANLVIHKFKLISYN